MLQLPLFPAARVRRRRIWLLSVMQMKMLGPRLALSLHVLIGALGTLIYSNASTASLPFATAPVAYRAVANSYVADAVVESAQQSTVAAQISGKILAVYFDVGDTVKQGQPIARIDERVVAQAATASRADVAREQANLQNARAAYERARQLVAQGFMSRAALDAAEAAYKGAQASATAAAANAQQSATTRGFATITAPYSGVVAQRHVQLGEVVSPGSPLLTGFDPLRLRAVASVPQYKLNDVRRARKTMVEFPALQLRVAGGETTVLPSADVKTHTTPVRVALPHPPRGVIPGMSARVHFVVGETQKLSLPASAVLYRSEMTGAYVVDANNRVQLRQLRLGEINSDGSIEVLSGVVPGERVALEPVKAGIYLRQQSQAR